jgi:K+-sensing histidine kinase KdpD
MLQQQYFGRITEKQKKSLTIVLKNTERLSKMIEDFLEISRIEAARLRFNFKKVNLRECVEETVQLMSGFAKDKNVKIVTNVLDISSTEMDPDRVGQVLRNLLHNAIKFSNKNSYIEVNVSKKGNFIIFNVKDNGVGISPQDQIRIFEPFYQSEEIVCREHEGTGLGLAICRGIVESQKGKIWVESTLGEGSDFYFTFPVRPVKEIEPIKLLFSLKSEIEKELKEEFILLLGPMGIVEFNELKNKNSIGRKDIINYIETLKGLKILNELSAEGFKTNISKIFGDYSLENVEEFNNRVT